MLFAANHRRLILPVEFLSFLQYVLWFVRIKECQSLAFEVNLPEAGL